MIVTNKVYDVLKWATLMILPALAVFYMSLASTWNLPYPTEIAGTIAAIDVFLALVLGISTNTFKVVNPAYKVNMMKLAGDIGGYWILSDQMYQVLTWIAQIFLPATAALYTAISGYWNLPYPEQVVSTIVALDMFLGMLLGFSTAQFHKKVSFACVEEPQARLPEYVE